RILRLPLQQRHDLAAVGAGPVENEEVRELGHGDAEERARLAVPVLAQGAAAASDDLDAGEVVRRLEPGGHHEDVDLALHAVDVDDASGRHRLDRAWHELDAL